MAYYLSPVFNEQMIDASGNALIGGKVYTYLAGTSTAVDTYTSSTGATLQANPIILNSIGSPTSPIWLLSGFSYKFILKDADDVTLRTIDNISGINDFTADVQNEWILSALTPTYISGTSFSFAGDQTLIFAVGRRIKTTNTAGTRYSTIATSSYAANVTTLTVTNDSGTLDSGLSVVSYALIHSTNPSLPDSAAVRNAMGISAAIQKQTNTAFTTAGTSTAYTLTPSPAITANTANTEFEVTFNAASGATPTLAVSGLTALPLKYRDSAGALQAIVANQIPSGFVSKVYTDGTNWIVLGIAASLAGGTAGGVPYQSAAGITAMAAAGSSHQVFKGGATPAFANAITLGIPQATTSGTAWDFTLSGTVLELVVHINQLSLSGTDYPRIQIGPSGGVETSGYVGSSFISGGGSIANASGVDINNGASAAVTISGNIRFRLMDSTNNIWSYSGTLSSSTNAVINVAGVKPLAGALNKVRLTTIAGTDTGDGGSVNVSY